MVADNGCGLPIIHQEMWHGAIRALRVFFSQHAMPEVVMNVIIPPPTPPTPEKKQVVKLVNFPKHPKTSFGKNSSSWKKLRNTANTSEFVQGHKNRAFKNQGRKRTNSQMYCKYQYFRLLRPQKRKTRTIPTRNWKRKNE